MVLKFLKNESTLTLTVQDSEDRVIYRVQTGSLLHYYFIVYCAGKYLQGEHKAISLIKPLKDEEEYEQFRSKYGDNIHQVQD